MPQQHVIATGLDLSCRCRHWSGAIKRPGYQRRLRKRTAHATILGRRHHRRSTGRLGCLPALPAHHRSRSHGRGHRQAAHATQPGRTSRRRLFRSQCRRQAGVEARRHTRGWLFMHHIPSKLPTRQCIQIGIVDITHYPTGFQLAGFPIKESRQCFQVPAHTLTLCRHAGSPKAGAQLYQLLPGPGRCGNEQFPPGIPLPPRCPHS